MSKEGHYLSHYDKFISGYTEKNGLPFVLIVSFFFYLSQAMVWEHL